jgi:hypothetical protein
LDNLVASVGSGEMQCAIVVVVVVLLPIASEIVIIIIFALGLFPGSLSIVEGFDRDRHPLCRFRS